MAEPRDALQIRVDDEEHHGNRPEPAHERVELEDGEQKDGERKRAETEHLGARQRSGRQLARCGARIPGVDLGVDQPVQPHRERAGADHRDGHPEPVGRRQASRRPPAASRRTRTAARRPCARASRATRTGAEARSRSRSCLLVHRLGAGQQAERVCERGLQHCEAVAAAAGRAGEVDDERPRRARRRPRARAGREASSRSSPRGSPRRSRAPRDRSPSASPRA